LLAQRKIKSLVYLLQWNNYNDYILTNSAFPFKVLTRQGLAWLKQIKESHGSVALTTMVQVEAINSSGIYYIADSKKAKESKQVDNGVKLCLENLVCLVVPKDEIKSREEKIYSLEEVKDVQSKLMLIAGKAESGKEEVDQFNQVCITGNKKQ
jgi:hypothetical protein